MEGDAAADGECAGLLAGCIVFESPDGGAGDAGGGGDTVAVFGEGLAGGEIGRWVGGAVGGGGVAVDVVIEGGEETFSLIWSRPNGRRNGE